MLHNTWFPDGPFLPKMIQSSRLRNVKDCSSHKHIVLWALCCSICKGCYLIQPYLLYLQCAKRENPIWLRLQLSTYHELTTYLTILKVITCSNRRLSTKKSTLRSWKRFFNQLYRVLDKRVIGHVVLVHFVERSAFKTISKCFAYSRRLSGTK